MEAPLCAARAEWRNPPLAPQALVPATGNSWRHVPFRNGKILVHLLRPQGYHALQFRPTPGCYGLAELMLREFQTCIVLGSYYLTCGQVKELLEAGRWPLPESAPEGSGPTSA